MSEPTLTCPSCSTKIPISKTLSDQVKADLSQEFKAAHEKQQLELEKAKKLLEEQEKEVAARKKDLEEEVKNKLDLEKQKIWKIAQAKAEENQGKAFKDLENTLKEKTQLLEEAEKHELALRKKTRELEEKEKKMELEMVRRIDEERSKIIDATKKNEEEQYALKLKEKDKQLELMQKTIADLKRQAEQGSMQIQGEVQEDGLKEILSNAFPEDKISDVPAGVRGADLVQAINGSLGGKTGTIIWESKNTKVFSDSWLAKLKSDQGIVKADAAILVTQAMPADIPNFGIKNGVWIVSYQFVLPLAAALRLQLIEISKLKQSLVGQDDKMNHLYSYLTGPQFKNRVENIVMAFVSMKQDLDTEKRSLQRIWSKREREIEKVILNTSSLYGDLQGIIGGSLPSIQQLELPEGELEIEDGQDEPQSLF